MRYMRRNAPIVTYLAMLVDQHQANSDCFMLAQIPVCITMQGFICSARLHWTQADVGAIDSRPSVLLSWRGAYRPLESGERLLCAALV